MRRALAVVAAALLAAAALGACGGGGGETTTVAVDKEADAELLNLILARQEAAVDAYEASLSALHDRANLAAARRFRAQEQAHVDGTLKSLRGLGAAAEPEPEEISTASLDSETEFLEFLYELEGATIEAEMSAIGRLTEPAPRKMLAATVANQAQHLAFLRAALGATPAETIPTPFENGTVAAP